MEHVIADVVRLSGLVREFRLRRRDGAPLAPWQAGAHIALEFSAADGRAYTRHYSLLGAPGPADCYRIAVQREDQGQGGSRCLHDEFGPGSLCRVSGPFNSFPLRVGAGRVLLVAGGIGITPLLAMAHALSAAGRPCTLHYLVRSADRLVLLDELRAIPHASIVLHVSQQSGQADLGAILGPYRDGDSCHACGPAALLQGLAAAAQELGWPAGAMHAESFGARARQDDGSLSVELALSGLSIEVAPGATILDALLAAGAFVSYDCKRGECGSCYAPVLAGEPLHRDICLTPAMRAAGMCTCVSWAKAPGRLVLEI